MAAFVGGAEATCDRAGWHHNVLSGFARQSKHLEAASWFGDPRKYYEEVSHEALWQEAKATDFNLVLLRCLLIMYGMDRTMSVEGAFSPTFQAHGTVIAGCSCATTLSRVLLYRTLKAAETKHPRVRFGNIVDDVQAQQVSTPKTILEDLGTAVRELKLGLRSLDLVMADDKEVILCSDPALGQQLETLWEAQGRTAQTTRCLGTDANDGGRRRVPVQNERITEASARSSRLLRLREGGGGCRATANCRA